MEHTPGRVLVIEDEPQLLEATVTYLNMEGYVADGVAGLESAVRDGPDVVLLDLLLPGLPGEQVLETLRRFSAVPVVVISSKREEDDRVGTLDLGADDYLVKPFSVRELIARYRVDPTPRAEALKNLPGLPPTLDALEAGWHAFIAERRPEPK
jgi:two-component system response regulator RegX3